MPRVTVIDHNERRILLHDGTAVRAIPCDPYHSLKYVQFDGNRIMYAFGGDRRHRIEETYNDGIFNAYRIVDGLDGEAAEQVVQISDALGLAKAVLSDNARAYDSIFAEWYGKKMQSEIVEYMIVAGNANRVAAVQLDDVGKDEGGAPEAEKAYVVDGRFMVDGRGAAYYLSKRAGIKHGDVDDSESEGGPRFSTNKRDWDYLCLVADDRKRGRADNIVDVPGKGAAAMTPVTRVVIAKIAFLLHPTDDRVFLNQLPSAMRRSVVRMISDEGAY